MRSGYDELVEDVIQEPRYADYTHSIYRLTLFGSHLLLQFNT